MTISKAPADRKRPWRVHWRNQSADNRRPYSYSFFRTRHEAEAFAAGRNQERTQLGEAWAAMPASMRAELIEAHQRAAAAGVSVVDAVKRLQVGGPAAKTIGDLVTEVVAAKTQKGLRPRSIESVSGTLASFVAGRQTLPMDRVTPAMVESFLTSRDVSQVRRRGLLTQLGSMFNFAVRRGYLLRSPCAAVERPIVENKATQVLTPDQAERLFRITESQDPDLLGFVALAAFGGFRTESEVSRMTRADVAAAVASGTLTPPVEGKTRRRRLVPVLPCLRAWLDVWLPLNVEPCPINFDHRWRRVRRAAGIVPWPQNVLRHSRASYRLAVTGDATLTASEDGHSEMILHRHYRALVSPEAGQRYFTIVPTPGMDLDAIAANVRASKWSRKITLPANDL